MSRKSDAKVIRDLHYQANKLERLANSHEEFSKLSSHDASRQHAIKVARAQSADSGTWGKLALSLGTGTAAKMASGLPIAGLAGAITYDTAGKAISKVISNKKVRKIKSNDLVDGDTLKSESKMLADHHRARANELRAKVDQLHQEYKNKYGKQVKFSDGIMTDRDKALEKYQKHKDALKARQEQDSMSLRERLHHVDFKGGAKELAAGAVLGGGVGAGIGFAAGGVGGIAGGAAGGLITTGYGLAKNTVSLGKKLSGKYSGISTISKAYHRRKIKKLQKKWGFED